MLSGTLYRNERNIVLRCVKLATVVSARRSVSGWRVLCGSAYVARHLQTLLSRPFPSPPPPPFFVVGCAHCQSSHFSFWRVSSDPKNHPAVSRADRISDGAPLLCVRGWAVQRDGRLEPLDLISSPGRSRHAHHEVAYSVRPPSSAAREAEQGSCLQPRKCNQRSCQNSEFWPKIHLP